MIDICKGSCRVWSDSPKAIESVAIEIADLFSQYDLASYVKRIGASAESTITVAPNDSEAVYFVKRYTVN